MTDDVLPTTTPTQDSVEIGETREFKYTQLISDLQSIATERAFRIELEKVEAKYDMGEAIIKSGLYEPYAYGQQLIPMISKDLGVGERTLYWVLQRPGDSTASFRPYPSIRSAGLTLEKCWDHHGMGYRSRTTGCPSLVPSLSRRQPERLSVTARRKWVNPGRKTITIK